MDKLLSLVDQATSRFGALNTVLDRVVERVVPQTTAAACSGVFCGRTCMWNANTDCAYDYPKANSVYYNYSYSNLGCSIGNYTCWTWSSFCC